MACLLEVKLPKGSFEEEEKNREVPCPLGFTCPEWDNCGGAGDCPMPERISFEVEITASNGEKFFRVGDGQPGTFRKVGSCGGTLIPRTIERLPRGAQYRIEGGRWQKV